MTKRSLCPISNVLDHLGDKWSLLILRDLMFFNKHSYSELQNSDEKVATNILSNRLEALEKSGLIQKKPDPKDKRKKIYSLTSAGIDTLPILLEMIIWSNKHSSELNIPTEIINEYHRDSDDLIRRLSARVTLT